MHVATELVAYSVLDSSSLLNNLTNRITGGRVNCDSLAKSIYKNTINLAVDYAVIFLDNVKEKNSLYKYKDKKHLLQHIRNALINDNLDTMRTSVAAIVKGMLLKHPVVVKGNKNSYIKELLTEVPASIAQKFATNYVGENALENLITTLVKNHGWDSMRFAITDAIKIKFIGKFVGNFASNLVTGLLQRAVVNGNDFDTTNNLEYKLTAELLNGALKQKINYAKPLREYAPKVMYIVDKCVSSAIQTARGLDYLHYKMGFKLRLQSEAMVFEKYGKKNKNDITIDLTTTPQEFTKKILLWIGTLNTEEEKELNEILETMLNKLETEQRKKLEHVVKALSNAQLKPLKINNINYRVTNNAKNIAAVEAHSYGHDSIYEPSYDGIVNKIESISKDSTCWGTYKVSTAFKAQYNAMHIHFDKSKTGIGGKLMTASKSLFKEIFQNVSYFIGGKTAKGTESQLDYSSLMTLRKLYDHCNKDPDLMFEVTRYLDPALIRSAAGDTMINKLAVDPDTNINILETKGVIIHLIPNQQPMVKFEISDFDQNFVHIHATVSYKIESYGTEGNMRKPIGSDESVLSANVQIHVRPEKSENNAKTTIFPLADTANIINNIKFDFLTGNLKLT